MPRTFFLVDGTALAYRSHFAFINNPLTNSKGQQTSATFGYVRGLLDLLEKEKPDSIAVAFDVSRRTFRKDMYAKYKATREKAPAEMKAQFGWIKEITEALGIAILELEGFEADDLIGTAAVAATAQGYQVRIVSGDKDMMQLVNEQVLLHDSRGVVGAEAVLEKFGVEPERVVDVLGLMGDSSDNVPGVPLIGPKKASALVRKWGSLEEVLAHAPEDKPSKTRQNLIDFADQARLSKELVTIRTDVPIDVPLGPAGERDLDTLQRLFKELDFTELYREVATRQASAADDQRYRVVEGETELAELVGELRAAGFFVLDTETTGPDPYRAGIVGIAFSYRRGESVYVAWSDAVARTLRPLLEDPAVAMGGHDLKFDAQVLRTAGIEARALRFDTMIAAYLIDPGRGNHALEALALRYLGIRKTPAEELVGKGRKQITMAEVEPQKVAHYAAEDADCAFRLVEHFRPLLAEAELESLFDEVEMPLVPVLLDMEHAGVKIDSDYLAAMSVELESQAQRLVDEIHELAGEPFNVNSPKQLSPILFEKLEIQKGSKKRPRRTKSGGFSTDAATLEAYAAHPIVAKLLEFRETTKLKSTYVDALPTMVQEKSGRIHSSFHQTVAATGRLSSADPNLQNIPVRSELGRRIRRAFIAEPGHKLLSADYSQIELRLMAHLSGDDGLRDVYRRGGDVHAETAARMFGLALDDVSRDQRGKAKAINFGILYGMGPQRLARDLKISMNEAKEFLEAYFREFPGVRDFQHQAVERARTEGYVTTLLGRRRAIPEIAARESQVRAAAENMAKNTPVQGTAADLIKIAMIRIHARLEKERFAARMILQVHDELVFEAPAAEVDPLAGLVVAEMEGALELEVPIVADVGVGENWLEAH